MKSISYSISHIAYFLFVSTLQDSGRGTGFLFLDKFSEFGMRVLEMLC